MTRIDVCITDPYTGAVVARFHARHRGFADMRAARVTANDPGLIVGRWETPQPRRAPLHMSKQGSRP